MTDCDETDNDSSASRNRARKIQVAIIFLAATTSPLIGRCYSDSNLITRPFGPKMNEVVMNIAHLSEGRGNFAARGLDFSPDGNTLAVDSDSGRINVWDWRKNQIKKVLEKPVGADDGLTTNPLQFSYDGQLLAACVGKGAGDVVIRVWNTIDWTVAKDVVDGRPGGCNAAQFTADNKSLIYVINRITQTSQLIVFPVKGLEQAWTIDLRMSPVSMAVSPKENIVAIGGITPVFPKDVSDPVKQIQQMKNVPTIAIVDLAKRETVTTVKSLAMGPLAWSPDGKKIAVAGRLYVEILDPISGQSVLSQHEEANNIRFTSDGRFLIESDHNETGRGSGLKIWDHTRNQLLQRFEGDIGSIAVSQDGKYLAVGETGRTSIWQFK